MLTTIALFLLYIFSMVAILVGVAIHGYLKDTYTLNLWEGKNHHIFMWQLESGWNLFWNRRLCKRSLHGKCTRFVPRMGIYTEKITFKNRNNFWSFKT